MNSYLSPHSTHSTLKNLTSFHRIHGKSYILKRFLALISRPGHSCPGLHLDLRKRGSILTKVTQSITLSKSSKNIFICRKKKFHRPNWVKHDLFIPILAGPGSFHNWRRSLMCNCILRMLMVPNETCKNSHSLLLKIFNDLLTNNKNHK